MRLIDITRSMLEAPIYPGAERTKITQVLDMEKGDDYNFSLISTNSHAGTHADALSHFTTSKVSIDQMQLDKYYGPCRVITVPQETMITKEDLKDKVDGVTRVILHGGGKSYLNLEAAKYLVECGIETIVTDAWSVAPLDNEVEIHQELLGAQIAIIENVTLEGVADGNYVLSAFPLKLTGCDGAPVRAVLIEE